MSGNTLIVVLPILALVIASLSVAGLWYWWTSSEEGKKEEADKEEPQEEVPLPALPRLGLFQREPAAVPPPASTAPPQNTIEVMRVFRDLADGSIIVEIAGQRYRRPSDITDPEIARRFWGNVQALSTFANLPTIQTSPPYPVTGPQQQPPPAMQPPPPSILRRPSSVTETAPRPPRRGLFGRRKADEQPPAPESRALVDEIEELLQSRLALTPSLAQRSIHIGEGPEGGVQIEVDGALYDGVEDVSDEEIRAFIQATIREWEDQR